MHYSAKRGFAIHVVLLSVRLSLTLVGARGVATGVDIGIYPPPKKKTAQVNFDGVKMTPERLFNSFIPPKNFYTPKTNFWLRPWLVHCDHNRLEILEIARTLSPTPARFEAQKPSTSGTRGTFGETKGGVSCHMFSQAYSHCIGT